MKVAVVGGAGYIGSCCTELLLDRGVEVLVLDSLVKGYADAVDERARFEQIDLQERDRLHDVLGQEKPDGIIHFGAYSEVGESMKHPGKYFRNNVANGLNLLDAALANGSPKIVFSSTAAVYGMPEKVPITEDQPLVPVNPYGESKLMFERMLQWYYRIHSLPYVALRYFNAAGATEKFGESHSPETHLIPNVLLTLLGQKEQFSLFGEDYPTQDGTCVRDYIHVVDLAEAHLCALESDVVGSFNLGSGSGYTVKEVIDTTEKVTGKKVPVKAEKRRAGDPAKLVSDSTAAQEQLGWSPKFNNLESIIDSAWRWLQKHPYGYKGSG